MIRRSLNDWRQIIAEQQSSGLNAAAFCRSKGINAKYFYLREQKPNAMKKEEPAFIKAHVKCNSVAGPSLCFNGLELRLNDASQNGRPNYSAILAHESTVQFRCRVLASRSR